MSHILNKLIEKRVKQDNDIEDKEGSQPAKYHSGLDKSTKQKRDAHFKAKKTGPAPGDADGVTKKSVHTKKYEKMFGESQDIQKALKKVKGLTKQQMQVLSTMSPSLVTTVMQTMSNLVMGESLEERYNKKADIYDDDYRAQVKYNLRQKMMKLKKEKGPNWNNDLKDAQKNHDAIVDLDRQIAKDRKKYQALLSMGESVELQEKITGLVNKAEKSGISYGILKKVYDRGLAAYKTGHRPGTTAPQWAFARVNSFITKGSGTWGKADKDLAQKVKGESFVSDEDFTVDEACWDSHMQKGMKKKGGKMVPNCVPKEDLGSDADAGDYIDDFRKSDAPQFKGKSDKKIRKMAVAAYLSKKGKKK